MGCSLLPALPLVCSGTPHLLKLDGWTWWLTLVIPALWEAEADGSQGQEFKTSLADMAKPYLQKLAGCGGTHL